MQTGQGSFHNSKEAIPLIEHFGEKLWTLTIKEFKKKALAIRKIS